MNKNIVKIIVGILLVLVIGGGIYLSVNNNTNNTNQVQGENLSNASDENVTGETTTSNEKPILIAYFSQTGNTEMMAEEIQSQIGGDLFKIETVEEYPSSYTELTQVAQAEIENGERPELKQAVENIEDYDVIFVGYPIWWHTTPAAVNSFLESYDLSGKTVVPFCTSGGNDIEETMEAVRNSCPNSNILEGTTISGSSSSTDAGKEQIRTWLEALDI